MWIISSKEIRLHAVREPVHAVVTDGESLPRRRTRGRRRGVGQGEVLVEPSSPHSKCRPRVRRREPSHSSALPFLAATSCAFSWQYDSVWPFFPQ